MNIVLSYFGKLILDSSPLREGRTENRTLYYTEQERKEGREASLAVFYFGNFIWRQLGGWEGRNKAKITYLACFAGEMTFFSFRENFPLLLLPTS